MGITKKSDTAQDYQRSKGYDDNGIVPPNESQTPASPVETACTLI